MSWEVLVNDEFERWWRTLPHEHQEALTARFGMLRDHGPALGRSTADTIQASRLANLKRLQASLGRAYLRVPFVFDPSRRAVLLVGGNKAGRWQSWYPRSIPEAERLYTQHVETMKRRKR